MTTEHEEAKDLVAWARKNANRVILVRVPNRAVGRTKTSGARNWARQLAEGASPGFPDYVLLLNNSRVLAWELKKAKAKPRPDQHRWLERFTAHGHWSGWGPAARCIAAAETLLALR